MLPNEKARLIEEDLAYELDMLDEAFTSWSRMQVLEGETRGQWFHRMSVIEAFWVHARNIEEFLSRRSDDAGEAAADHFTTATMHYDLQQVSGMISAVQNQIVHLQYGRPQQGSSDRLDYWKAERAKGCIDRAIVEFQENLTAEAQAIWKRRLPPIHPGYGLDVGAASTSTLAFGITGPSVIANPSAGYTGPAPPRANT